MKAFYTDVRYEARVCYVTSRHGDNIRKNHSFEWSFTSDLDEWYHLVVVVFEISFAAMVVYVHFVAVVVIVIVTTFDAFFVA